MQAYEEKYIYDWEQSRGKGKWSYRILTAVVWGTLLPLGYVIVKLLLRLDLWPSSFKAELFHSGFLHLWLRSMGCVFLFASLMWYLSAKKYKELKQKQLRKESFREAEKVKH